MESEKVEELRINVLIRLLSIVLFALALLLLYLTANTPLIPQLSTIFYLIGGLMVFFSLLTLISKFE
ncbi:MAG: hypothetical protein QXX95_04410 [Nitrososphaerales archaeon]